MPLKMGKSKEAFSHNIKAEMNAGKPQKQALAIAYATRRKKKMASGGQVPPPPPDPDKAKDFMRGFGYSEGGDVNEKLHPHFEPKGLMKSPKHIAKMIMMKKKMSKGGMADCYADGGMVDEEPEAMDQLEDMEMGAEDFLSHDDNDELEDMKEEDPKKKMRMRIMQVMSK